MFGPSTVGGVIGGTRIGSFATGKERFHMRKLSNFLLLPLLSLPLRLQADNGTRSGEDIPRDPAGDLRVILNTLVRRCLSAPRRLLTHSATAQEIHVITQAADADARQTTPPARRAGVRRIVPRVLPATPLVRPRTT
jgi:hypothetical protein